MAFRATKNNKGEHCVMSEKIDFSNMTVSQLKEYAEVNEIPLDNLSLKADIIAAIEAVMQPSLESLEIQTNSTPKIEQAETVPDQATNERCIARALRVTKPLMRGDDVKIVQAALIAQNFHCGVEGANGIYNATTARAVRLFQANNRLIVSGKVDKFTATALGLPWTD